MATPIPANKASFDAAQIASITHGTTKSDARGRGITSDSRAVEPGSIFVALRGERVDGHDYIEEALRRGASIVVAETPGEKHVQVADTLVAWGDLARAHLLAWKQGTDRGRVVAITGSAGKTTTK